MKQGEKPVENRKEIKDKEADKEQKKKIVQDDIIKKEVKNSELQVPKNKLAYLTKSNARLVPCFITEQEDGVVFHFQGKDLRPAKRVKSLSWAEKLQFLINASQLIVLCKEYDFSMALENMMVDLNLQPLILHRDKASLITDGAESEDDREVQETFVLSYKALIGSLVSKHYTYEDFYQGGGDYYKKDAFLANINKETQLDEIVQLLNKAYQEANLATKRDLKLVSKKGLLCTRIALPIVAVLFLIAGFFAVTSIFYEIPHRDSLIQARSAYIARDYLGVQQALNEIAIDNMTHETRHILARAYVHTEPLSDTQQHHVLMGLTLLTDPILFDYWIAMGRAYMEQAIDLAQRMGDNELLLFALLKQEAIIQADTSIPGETRATLLADLGRQIGDLRNERIQAMEVEEVAEEVYAYYEEDSYAQYGEYDEGVEE